MQYITQLALARRPHAIQHAPPQNENNFYLLSQIVKEQPIGASEEAPINTAHAALIAVPSKDVALVVEPIGIEPMTSCLQSRRSPN